MKIKVIMLGILLVVTWGAIGFILCYSEPEAVNLVRQETVNQEIAERYLLSAYEQFGSSAEEQPADKNADTSETLPESDLLYDDDARYAYYKDAKPQGHIDCVLEIPAIGLRQCIYTGTSDEIMHDLSVWFPVTARADYVLGATRYCIYMHNPRDHSLKISEAQGTLKSGDYMLLTKNDNVFFYRIEPLYAQWRNICTDTIVNNDAVARNKMYIFTCAREEWDGQNLVIEGTLENIYSVSDWEVNGEKYIAEFKLSKENDETVSDSEPEQTLPLTLKVSVFDKEVSAEITAPDFTTVNNCSIAVMDVDGNLCDFGGPIEYVGSPIVFSDIPVGEYIIGVYENNTEFSSPIPYRLTAQTKTHTISKVIMTEYYEREEQEENMWEWIALGMVCMVSAVLLIAFIRGIIMLCKKDMSGKPEQDSEKS